jgi:hypothetical protein
MPRTIPSKIAALFLFAAIALLNLTGCATHPQQMVTNVSPGEITDVGDGTMWTDLKVPVVLQTSVDSSTLQMLYIAECKVTMQAQSIVVKLQVDGKDCYPISDTLVSFSQSSNAYFPFVGTHGFFAIKTLVPKGRHTITAWCKVFYGYSNTFRIANSTLTVWAAQ